MTPVRPVSRLLPRPGRSTVLTGVVALMVLGGTACGVDSTTPVTSTATPRSAPVVAPSDPCASTTCSIVPNLTGLTAPQALQTLQKAQFAVPSELTTKGEDITVTAQYPGGGMRVPVTTAIRLSYGLPPLPPAPPRKLTARDWALIAKDPAAHTGERIVVYGQVTQFDAATGTSSFRANVDGVEHRVRYGYADYETNTVLTGSEDVLKELVNDDLFRAEATVSGAYSYSTTLGGNLTVPRLEVTAITVTGTAK